MEKHPAPQSLLLALLGVLLLIFSMPPFSLGALAVLGLMLVAVSGIASFWWLWLLGILLNIGLTFWLGWVSALAVAALPIVSGLFFALPLWYFQKSRAKALSGLLWVVLEGFRSYLGWGWLPLAAAFAKTPALLGWVSIAGEGMLTFLIVYLSLGLADALRDKRFAFAPFFTFLLLLSGGLFLQIQPAASTTPAPVAIALVQPNIPMALNKDAPALLADIEALEKLTTPLRGRADIIFWPEQQTPWAINNDERMRTWAETGAQYLGANIVAGALWEEGNRFYNAVSVVLPQDGLSSTFYAKRRLVPFGEYVPFAQFGWMRSLTPIVDSFAAGEEGVVLEANGWKFWPLVCYEDTFPYLSLGAAAKADTLLVVTNDGWFGPHAREQHLAHSILRSVEQGLPLIRVSNDGISGILYPDGSSKLLPSQNPTAEILTLTPSKRPTLYAQHQALFMALPPGLLMLLAVFRRFRK